MRILALDQSTSRTGWAFVDTETASVSGLSFHYGVVKTPGKLKGIDACWYQVHEVDNLLKKYEPDAVSLECLFMGSNGGPGGARKANPYIAFLLGELRGMLRMTVYRYCDAQIDLATHEISVELGLKVTTPRTVKKRAARQRAASVLWYDRSLWEKIGEDEADAIVMLQIAIKRLCPAV